MAGYESGAAKTTSSGIEIHSNQLAFEGKGGELVFGYGKTFDKYYVGLETSFSFFDADGSAASKMTTTVRDETLTFKTKISKKDSAGLFVRVGYHPYADSLVYGKVGLVSSKFHFGVSNAYSEASPYDYDFEFKKRIKGISIGVGTEIKLFNGIFGRLEASHIQYDPKKFGFNFLGAPAWSCPKVMYGTTLKLHSNEIKLGIISPLSGQ